MSEFGGVFTISNNEVEFTLFTVVLRTFDDAQVFCEDLGRDSSLARISTSAEFDLVEEAIEESQTPEGIWIGKLLKLNCSITLLYSRVTRSKYERKC